MTIGMTVAVAIVAKRNMVSTIESLAAFEAALNNVDLPELLALFDVLRVAVTVQGNENLRLSGRVTNLESQIRKLKVEIKAKDLEIIRLRHEQYAPAADAKVSPKTKPKDNDTEDEDHAFESSNATDETSRDPKVYSGTPPQKDKREGGRGPKNWDALPRVDVPYDGPNECPCGCGGTVRGKKIQERLEVIPAVYYVAVTEIPTVRCRLRGEQGQMVSLPFSPSLLPGTGMGSSALAHFVTQRFAWGLPWYRIETMLRYTGWMRFSLSPS